MGYSSWNGAGHSHRVCHRAPGHDLTLEKFVPVQVITTLMTSINPLKQGPGGPHSLLTRAASLLRLPTSPDERPEVLPNGAGLRCPVTGTVHRYGNGVLDLLSGQQPLTVTQQALNTRLTAWGYVRFRGLLLRLGGLPRSRKRLPLFKRSCSFSQTTPCSTWRVDTVFSP